MKTMSRLALCALFCALLCLASGCAPQLVKVAVPNSPTDRARALLLLDEKGLIELEEGVGVSATKDDIVDNPHNIDIVETESTALMASLQTVDFAVINANIVLEEGYSAESALVLETVGSQNSERYENVVATRQDDADSQKIKALVAVLQSATAREYLSTHYAGLVVPAKMQGNTEIEDAEEGDEVIRVGASASPHAEVLEAVRPLLENHGYKLEVVVYEDYKQPNTDLSDGRLDANYMQHLSNLLDYNAKNGTNLVSAGGIHCELMGVYAGKKASLDDLR